MKRVVLLILLTAVLLCGCESVLYDNPFSTEPYTVTLEEDGEITTLLIDPKAKTIHDGSYTYDYSFNQDDIIIYYPKQEGIFSRGHGEESGSYTSFDEGSESGEGTAYIDGNTLANIVEQQMTRQRQAVELNLVLFIVGIGILAIGIRRRAYPYYPWRKIFGFHSRKHKHHNQHKEDSSQEHEHKHKHKHISGTKNRRIGVAMIVSGAVLILAGLIL